MFERIVSIITPVILIILVGWLYGRKAHPDMAGINRATLDVIAPLLVVSAFVSKEFVLADQLVLLACAVAVVLGSGVLAWAVARLLKVDLLRRLSRDRTVAVLVDDDPAVCTAAERAGFTVFRATWMDEQPALYRLLMSDYRQDPAA